MTTKDPYAGTSGQVNYAPRNAVAIAHNNPYEASDDFDLPQVLKAVWVGGAGNLRVLLAGDNDGGDVTLDAIPAGTMLRLQIRRIFATNTSATLLVGFLDL